MNKATNTEELRKLASLIKVGTHIRIDGYVSSQNLPEPLTVSVLPDDYAAVMREREIAALKVAEERTDTPEGMPIAKIRAYVQARREKLEKPLLPNAADSNIQPVEEGSRLYSDGESLYLLRCWTVQVTPPTPKDPVAAWISSFDPPHGTYVHKIKLSDLKFSSVEVY